MAKKRGFPGIKQKSRLGGSGIRFVRSSQGSGGAGSDDQIASEVPFTPDGDIAATDVQAAIEEVRDDTDTKLSAKAPIASPEFTGPVGIGITPTEMLHVDGHAKFKGKKITETAGESLIAGDWCYLKSDGKFWKTDASAEATSKGLLYMSTAVISADATGEFIEDGEITLSSLTAGSTYYLSETAGAMTTTKPVTSGAIVRIVGYAKSTTKYHVKPSQSYIELA